MEGSIRDESLPARSARPRPSVRGLSFYHWPSRGRLFRLGTAVPDTEGRGRAVKPDVRRREKTSRVGLSSGQVLGETMKPPAYPPLMWALLFLN